MDRTSFGWCTIAAGMSFDASLHALLLRNQGTDRRMQFAVVPSGFTQEGDWGLRMIEIRGEEWPWLKDLKGVNSKCVRHLHDVLVSNGFSKLCNDCPHAKKARSGTQTHWYWKPTFSPDTETLDTPPRMVPSKGQPHRELQRQLQREKERNKTLRRCLQASEQKRVATQEHMRVALLAADDEKRAVMKILRTTQYELDMAKQLLDIGDLSGVSLSPVQVDQMLDI